MANLKKSAPWNALNEEKRSLNRASVGKTYKFKISSCYDLTSDLYVGHFEDESSFLIQKKLAHKESIKFFPQLSFRGSEWKSDYLIQLNWMQIYSSICTTG